MFAYINGIVALIQEEVIVIDVQGVGYEINCANPYEFQPLLNKKTLVYTYHHVREDTMDLYGFKTEDEKKLFTKLISVSGIGPKSAILILGTVNVNDFISAVETEDEKYLTQFRGVGKKTARQIILDLKGKLTEMQSVESTGLFNQTTDSTVINEAEEALIALGYRQQEISAILPELRKSELVNVDEVIKLGLSLLLKK
ncbi:MAG TPA: Holliday junction branch migration protein RuvA [Pseudogracilibacillus sp.]|nr:Holliday junction branch migration protein RuvA [Pseudogracilibacillus sp.]